MAEWDADMAQQYAELWGEHPTHDVAIELAALRADDVLVDVGCGSGAVLRRAAGVVARAIGVDPTEEMRLLAAEALEGHAQADRVELRDGTAAALPLADGEATVALAVHSLHHWDEAEVALAELHRALRPGGRLLILEEDRDGRLGHGEGGLSRPEVVLALVAAAGFAAVAVEAGERDGAPFLAIRALRP